MLGHELERLYEQYNRREFVRPDPIQFLYDYEDVADREVVAIIASALAFGNVTQIVASVATVLGRVGRPLESLRNMSEQALRRRFEGFRHRFVSGDDLAAMLVGVKGALERHGSLEACFAQHLGDEDETVRLALSGFALELGAGDEGRSGFLIPAPERGSACKRLNLFLRWMVRRDAVDPGGWVRVPSSKLIVPLDTHLHRISRSLGLTARAQPNMRTALEVTAALRQITPNDPVRYDFALTRLGIRTDTDLEGFLRRVGVKGCRL